MTRFVGNLGEISSGLIRVAKMRRSDKPLVGIGTIERRLIVDMFVWMVGTRFVSTCTRRLIGEVSGATDACRHRVVDASVPSCLKAVGIV